MPESDPIELAGWVNDRPRPWLIGVDIDGTLAPIVARPELSRLVPGAAEALDALAARIGVMVAVVSGRPMADLHDQFRLPSSVMLLGSHGAEIGTEADARTVEEQAVVDSTLKSLQEVVDELPGAWIEHKPLALALHVRQAEPRQAILALSQLESNLRSAPGITVHHGHKVLEIAVRPASKASSFDQLRRRLEPETSVFIGDDSNDELVFQSLGPRDISIKVGVGPTSAAHRFASPHEVVKFLRTLADSE
jgi:trehalose 6-phosphate phosphatase